MDNRTVPPRHDDRIIIHFDYDCFYASVFEAKNPNLKSLPFAVQQKQIIVTCNYEARRRGLHKLQLISDAKRVCPDVIIELGEDISRFRDASKDLYTFIKDFSWNNKIERLGFDEVWMDVSDMVTYNASILNRNDLPRSFFHMSREDPTVGFAFDATSIAGHYYPKKYTYQSSAGEVDDLTLRLRLGSHLALHIRHQLEQQRGYTCTVGIATSKLISKLVGNLNKPKGQTTLMPPLGDDGVDESNVARFIDSHDIGKLPGIGFKLAQKLREFVLQRAADFDASLVYGGTKEDVKVVNLRKHPDVNPEMLEKLLAGPGSPHGIGHKIWSLIHGVDDTEVSEARAVPRQISIEDSYIRLDTLPEVIKELTMLAKSLLTRMRLDLLGVEDDLDADEGSDGPSDTKSVMPAAVAGKKWLAHPKTLRLTTRPRQPLQSDGTRVRSFKRISHSGPLPNFVLNLSETVEGLAERLVKEALVHMFRHLHPQKAGWNLSLVNLAVTNMAETAGNSRTANGRDIGNMFRKQEDVLKDFKIREMTPPLPEIKSPSLPPDDHPPAPEYLRQRKGSEDIMQDSSDEDDVWDEEGNDELDDCCGECGLRLPAFAMIAHRRFHSQPG